MSAPKDPVVVRLVRWIAGTAVLLVVGPLLVGFSAALDALSAWGALRAVAWGARLGAQPWALFAVVVAVARFWALFGVQRSPPSDTNASGAVIFWRDDVLPRLCFVAAAWAAAWLLR